MGRLSVLTFSLLASHLSAFPVNLQVEQSFDGVSYGPAGRIIEQGDGFGTQRYKVAFERSSDIVQDIEFLKKISAENGLYYIRIPVQSASAAQVAYVSASYPAKCVTSAGLQEELTLHLSTQGDVLALQYGTSTSQACTPSLVDSTEPSPFTESTFSSKVTIVQPLTDRILAQPDTFNPSAMPPNTQQSNQEGQQRQQQQPEQPQDVISFIKKNWLFLVVGLWIISIVGAQGDPPQQQAQAPARS